MEWQPIETAPKRGTAIDIWSPTYGRLANYRRISFGRGNVFYDPVDAGVCCVRDATHWMKIPKAPK